MVLIHSKSTVKERWEAVVDEYKLKSEYCTISFNSAGPMTRDGPAEILVSATSQTCRDMSKFSDIFGSFALQTAHFYDGHQMFSAPGKNRRDERDYSVSERGCVTRDCRIERNGTVCEDGFEEEVFRDEV